MKTAILFALLLAGCAAPETAIDATSATGAGGGPSTTSSDGGSPSTPSDGGGGSAPVTHPPPSFDRPGCVAGSSCTAPYDATTCTEIHGTPVASCPSVGVYGCCGKYAMPVTNDLWTCYYDYSSANAASKSCDVWWSP